MSSQQLSAYMIPGDAPLVEALQKIDANGKNILFVIEEDNILSGVITDGDIRRWLLKTGDLTGNVQKAMNPSPAVIYHEDVRYAMDKIEKYKITALPVLSSEGKILDIVFGEQDVQDVASMDTSLKDVSVVIMAGGKGTRLYPYTKILPKPLIPIGDIPIMERIINRFQSYGVQEFYATVNYRKNMIKSYFAEASQGYKIHYVEEEKPLGTAGSLQLIQGELKKPFIVSNCDILIQADYHQIYKHHISSGNELTMVTALKNVVIPYGVVHSKEEGVVSSIEEKPCLTYFVNTGMYVMNAELLEDIPKDTFFHMTDLTDKLLQEGRKVGMYPISEESFLDMGEFEEMYRMEEKLNLKSE